MAERGAEPGGPERITPAPFVTVMMAAFDAERFVGAAIESVLAQDYPEFELLVVDDGSRDATWEILQRYAARDARVRTLQNPKNLGIVATRNRMLDEADARAKYLAVLDADDLCLPRRLARQVEFLERHPAVAAVGSHTRIVDEHGRDLGLRRYPVTADDIRRVITRYNPIAQPAVMIRRSALQTVGRYDPRYPRCQDYDLWLRLAEHHELGNLDEPLIAYRISTTQVKQRHLRESLRLTIDIQRRWLFARRFWNPWNVAYWAAEHALLALPDAWVMGAFKRLTYRRGAGGAGDGG